MQLAAVYRTGTGFMARSDNYCLRQPYWAISGTGQTDKSPFKDMGET